MNKVTGAAELECDIGTSTLELKALGARIDLTSDSLEVSALGVTVPLHTGASGHYQLDVGGTRQLPQSEVKTRSNTPSLEDSFIIPPDSCEGSDQSESSEALDVGLRFSLGPSRSPETKSHCTGTMLEKKKTHQSNQPPTRRRRQVTFASHVFLSSFTCP